MKNSIKFGIPIVVVGVLLLVIGISFGQRIDNVNSNVETAISGLNSKIENVVSFLSTTTTSTTTTTTTTTTLPPAPAKPAKSALLRKVEELLPGSTDKYPAKAIEAGGAMACRMWVDGAARFSTIREINNVLHEYYIDDTTLATIISTAVLWTICPVTKSFPNGPLEF